MVWKKINSAVSMWEKPALGTLDQKDGKRYMALCIDPSSKNPYRGIAREVTSSEGNPNISGFIDRSSLVIVESRDLLEWEVVKDLKLKKIGGVIQKLSREGEKKKEFIGIEDPDIIVDESGTKQVYFTIAFKYSNEDNYEVHLGHASGKSLENLTATMPVLKRVNEEIVGFKETCFVPEIKGYNMRLVLTETFVNHGKGREYPATGVSKVTEWSDPWKYLKLAHDPEKESKNWCSGDSSPCRIFDPKILNHHNYLVGIINGRQKPRMINGERYLGDFTPGLFLFDPKKLEIPWTSKNHLFNDPDSTGITFASELIQLNKKEALLYAHPNDSFVRVYKLNIDKIKKMLPEKI